MNLTDKQREAVDAVERYGSQRLAAEALGIDESSLRERLKQVEKRRNLDPAVQASMVAVGTDMVPALAWAKTKSEDGTSYSVLLKPEQQAGICLLDRIVAAFDHIRPIPPIPPPGTVITSRLAAYKLFDWHLGQHSWGRETGGQDYDLALGASDLRMGLTELMQDTPNTEHALLIFGGDNLHVDDSRSETPANKHKLDADGRYQKIIDTAIDAIAFACDSLLAKHQTLTLVIHRGNHDPHAHIALRTGMRQRYRDNPRITIWSEPFDIFWFQFGAVGIFTNHGDRSKPETLALEIADKCPFYSQVQHRYLYTGHRHRESVQQLPGLLHEGLGPVAPADAYGARFSGRRTMYSTTFDARTGRKARAYDSLDRRNVA